MPGSLDDQQRMQCMEVWGGNQLVDSGVVMAGLDAWVYSRPYHDEAGGGDVYYVSACATGRINRLLVADVSGHGAEIAQTAVALRTLMRRYVNYIDQTQFVRAMNRQFGDMGEAGCFATAIVTTFFAPTNDLTLCNAGHPPPLLYRARDRRWAFLEQESADDHGLTNIPLGIEGGCDYEQFGVRLGASDLVLCYTDSLIESRGADGELLGTEGLLEIVRSLDPLPEPTRLIPELLERIGAKFDGNLSGDDVTVLLFRPNALGPSVPWRDRLMAPLRVLAGIVRSLTRKDQPAPWPEISLPNLGGAMIPALSRLWGGRAATATTPTAPAQVKDIREPAPPPRP